MSSPLNLPATEANLQQIVAGKNYYLAALTLILYDHALTFPDEVRTVWRKKKTFVLYVFLILRYYAPIAIGIVAFGYFSPFMTGKRCTNWMLFLPLGITMPMMLGPGILMTIRVYAMYNKSKLILACLTLILVTQTAAGIWQYSVKGGRAAPDPVNNYEFHFCIYLPPASLGRVSAMYVFIELAFDTTIFILTLARTLYVHINQRGVLGKQSLLRSLASNGALYFGVIFSTNLTWALMILHAPTGLRAIAAVPTSALTTVFICRITLNLRTSVYGGADKSLMSVHPIGGSGLRNQVADQYQMSDIKIAKGTVVASGGNASSNSGVDAGVGTTYSYKERSDIDLGVESGVWDG